MLLKNKHLYLLLIFIFCFIGIELGVQTFLLGASLIKLKAHSWFFATLILGVSYIYYGNNQSVIIPKNRKTKSKDDLILMSFLLLLCSFSVWVEFSKILQRFPIDAKLSDVIPSVQVYVQRFLSGQNVYEPIHFDGYSFSPPYFPFTWLPYCIAEILKLDYRIFAMAIFYLVNALYLYSCWQRGESRKALVFKTLLGPITLFFLVKHCKSDFGMSVELLPSAFYLFLGFSLLHRSTIVMAIGILFCLLSRYSLFFWLPLYFYLIYKTYDFKKTANVVIYVGLGVLCIYILPFLATNWHTLTAGLKAYDSATLDQWKTQSWQPEGALPHHLSRGLSYALHFYQLSEPDVMKKMFWCKYSQIGLSILSVVLLWLFFQYKKFDTKIFALGSLKIYFAVFYGFMYMPFSYLYLVPLFFTLAMVYEYQFDEN